MNRYTALSLLVVAVLGGAAVWWTIGGGGANQPGQGSAPPEAEREPVHHDMVRVSAPSPGDTVESPLRIDGTARGGWFFEASFPVTLLHEDGSVLAEHYATAEDEWMTDEFVSFSSEILFSHPGQGRGWLILHRSNPSGRPEHDDEVRIPVRFADSETREVVVHFGRKGEAECEETVAVPRIITRTDRPAHAALEHLLAGPTSREREEGYHSAIPSGVSIQRLTLQEGSAKVDLSEQLEVGSGGSCHAQAIRSQIESTLLQFPSVETVVISINGSVDDILQP